jgi:hypothetical protein
LSLVRQIFTVTDASNCNSGTARNYGKPSMASDINKAMCTKGSADPQPATFHNRVLCIIGQSRHIDALGQLGFIGLQAHQVGFAYGNRLSHSPMWAVGSLTLLFVRPALCLRLPPDSQSPATPLPFSKLIRFSDE